MSEEKNPPIGNESAKQSKTESSHGTNPPVQPPHNAPSPGSDEHKADDHKKPPIVVRFWYGLLRRRTWRRMRERQEVNLAEKIGVGVASCILVVAVIQAIIYNRQANLMQASLEQNERSIILNRGQLAIANRNAGTSQEANKISRESLESVQRAYLTFPPSPEVEIYGMPNGPLVTLNMPIENNGNTAAHKIRDRVSCVTPMGIPSNSSFPDINGRYCGTPWAATGANVIPAKGSLLSQKIQLETRILDEFMKQNQGPWPKRFGLPSQPSRSIRFYGWVTYRDIFDKTREHLSEFCRDLATFVIVPPNQGQAQWAYCPAHNCTDEDCPDYEERIKAAYAAPICCKEPR
jgi:hypothetical protein